MPYIGNTIRAADDYRLIDDISSSFNGSTTSFALQVAGSAPVPFPKSPQQVLISVNGVIQEPDPTGASGFNLVGTNIVFSSAPTNGHAFFGIIYATADYLNSGGNFPSGSLGAPSITFIGDEDSGLYRKGAGSVGFVSDATEIANFDSNGITISSGNIIIPDSIIHNGDPNTKIRFPAADTITVETSGSEHLRVNSSGTVLISTASSLSTRTGTSSFTPSLQISSDSEAATSISRFSNSTDPGRLSIQKGRGTIASKAIVQDNDNIGQILFSAWDGDTFTNAARIEAEVDGTPGDDDMPGRLIFATTADGSATSTERMRIDSSGFVGIGTTSPNFQLDVETDGSTEPCIRIRNSGTAASADSRLRIQTGGTGATSQSARIEFGNADDSDNGIIRYFTGSGERYFAFVTNASERMRIDSSGNIGIGTSSPSGAALHVSRGAAVVKVETTTAGNSSRLIIKSPVDSYAGIHFGDDSDEDVGRIRYYHSSNFMQFVTDTTERMRIVGSKIGIGTTSPDQTVHIHKASAGSASSDANSVLTLENSNHCILQMLSPAANSGRIMFGDPDDNNAGEINYDHNINSLIIKTGGNERIRVDEVGRLLIGTSATRSPGGFTPQFQIEGTNVSSSSMTLTRNTNDGGGPSFIFNKTRGTSDGADVIVNSGDTLGIVQWVGNDGSNSDSPAAWIYGQVDGTPGSDDMPGRLIFATTADGANSVTERMRINSSGNVGIGTTSPAGKMHVNAAENTAAFLAEGEVDNPAYPAYCFSGQNNDNGGRGTGMYLPGDNQLAFATVAQERLRIDANGNFDFNNGAFMASFGSDTNIDAFHHDDSDNTWIFNSDTTLKATTGTSKLRCAGVDFGDNNNNSDILDEYEEGTWTPTLKFGGSSSGITYDSNNRGGVYTRIGRVVTLHWSFLLTDKGSQSGHAEIHGIPFNAADYLSGTTVECNGMAAFWDNVDPNLYNIMYHTNTSHIEIKVIDGAEDKPPDATNNTFQDNTSIRGTLTYFTAT